PRRSIENCPSKSTHADKRRERYGSCSRERNLIALDKFAETVCSRWRARFDGLICEIAPEIVGQCSGRLVSALAVFFHGPHDDPIELAAYIFAQPGWFRMSVGCDRRERI